MSDVSKINDYEIADATARAAHNGLVGTVVEALEDLESKIPTGAAAGKGVDTTISAASTSTNLPTSKAVAAFVEGKGYKTTDTKNTAGSTDTSSKIYLIGATSQAANPQTYSDDKVYAKDGFLYADKLKTTQYYQVGNRYIMPPVYNYTNGALIEIGASAASTMVVINVTGNGYGNNPIDTRYTFYDYTSAGGIINADAVQYGSATGPMYAYRYNGKLYAWVKQQKSFQTLVIEILTNKNITPTIKNAAKHTSDDTSEVTSEIVITPVVIPVAQGGTGITSNPSMLVNLASASADTVFKTTPRPGVTGTLPIVNGGTGATTAEGALTNLGIAPVATSGSYNDLSNKPTIPTVSVSQKLTSGTEIGSVTVNGTATKLYAPTATGGLGEQEVEDIVHDQLEFYVQKQALEEGRINLSAYNYANKDEGVFYVEGTSTAAGTWLGSNTRIAAYYDGLTILYKINKAGATTTTLNINSLGAKTVYRYGTTKLTTHYPVNSVILLTYMADLNSGCWMVTGDYNSNDNTVPTAHCTTAAATGGKTATCTYYTATANSYTMVLMRYANTYNGAITLNINSTGAKPVYINGAASSSTNKTLPAGTYLVYYDGTKYHFRTDGKLPHDGASSVSEIDTWYSDVYDIGSDDVSGIHWKDTFAFLNGSGTDVASGLIHHRTPLVAGDNVTFTVDEANQVVKINATGGGSSSGGTLSNKLSIHVNEGGGSSSSVIEYDGSSAKTIGSIGYPITYAYRAKYDTNGNELDTYIKNITVSGNTLTFTKGDNTTGTATLPSSSGGSSSGGGIRQYNGMAGIHGNGADAFYLCDDYQSGTDFVGEVELWITNGDGSDLSVINLYSSDGAELARIVQMDDENLIYIKISFLDDYIMVHGQSASGLAYTNGIDYAIDKGTRDRGYFITVGNAGSMDVSIYSRVVEYT